MRYLVIGILFAVATRAGADTVAESLDALAIEHFPPFELVREHSDTAIGRHLLPMGALEIVRQELVPEDSLTVTGKRASRTYYLPDARRTAEVAGYYEPQLAALGEILYQCKGRTCGGSFYWANTIFDTQILYGPEKFQYYYLVRLADSVNYLKFYIGERATRKIHVHEELVVPDEANLN